MKSAVNLSRQNKLENLGLKPSQLIIITSKLQPENDESYQYILTKPVDINYLHNILGYVIRGLSLCLPDALSLQERDENIKFDHHMLLADDNDFCRAALVKIAAKYAQSITECDNGKKALEIFKRNPQNFDIAIFDYQMPEMSGLNLIESIRELERRDSNVIPIQIICNLYILKKI